MEKVEEIINFINEIVWGYPMLFLIVGVGLFLAFGLNFLPQRKFFYGLKKVFVKEQSGLEGDISSQRALATSLSATIGTGNIAGVATAIVVGGPGALFWMWITAIFGMSTKYAEAMLAVKFREKDEKGNFVGGPMYFIKNGVSKGWRWLAGLFAFFAIFAALGIGNSVQSNSIADVLAFNYSIPKSITGGVLVVLIFAIITGGIRRIAMIVSKLVPLMVVVYFVVSVLIIFLNIDKLPDAFGQIFSQAFSGSAAAGGFIGMVIIGVARGVFSNEAGLGSSAIAHAAARTDSPVKQGLVATLGVFLDTIIICTLTGLVIIISGLFGEGSLNGASLTTQAFDQLLPGIGSHVVALSLVFFAFTTILGWAYYGERSVQYLLSIRVVPVYRVFWVAFTYIGTLLHLDFVWLMADTMNALMAIPNLLALVFLSPLVFKMSREYFSSSNQGDLKP